MTDIEERDPRFAELEALIKAEDAAPPPAPRNPRAGKLSRSTPRKARPRKRQPDARRPDHAALAQGKQLARQFADIIREKLGQQLNRAECIQVAQAFKSAMVPKRKPGRHPHADITEAVEMRKAGKPWPAIFEALVPGLATISHWRRNAVKKRLREGVRTRQRRERHRSQQRQNESGLPQTVPS